LSIFASYSALSEIIPALSRPKFSLHKNTEE